MKKRVEIDVRWIKQKLDKIDQDDRVCLVVEDRGGGRLRATGLSQSCRWDGTINPGLSTGSRAVSEQPNHAQDNDDDEKLQAVTGTLTPTPIPTGPPGTVTGIVTNALTGAPLANATVRVDGSTATATSGNDGRFVLAGVPSGTRTLRTTATGFVTEVRTVAVVANASVEQAIALTPARPGGQITIVLTWSTQPQDLDAHLSGPNRSGGRFHVYYASRSQPLPNPYATLDVDDTTSFGPETITISRDPNTGLFAAGEYRYWVHNFSTDPEFDVSDARVTVSSGGSQLDSFNVPGGAATLDIWRVVNLTVDTAGNVTLTPVQTFAAGFDTTVFLVPPGSAPAPTSK
ncbi:MAG: carboxypeptidase regulatory-like domain-containing protein [Chloroflexota bacterium]